MKKSRKKAARFLLTVLSVLILAGGADTFCGQADSTGTLIGAPIYVNGAFIEDARIYLNDDGIVMVPLRLISDKLGYDIRWDGGMKQVSIGEGTVMTIGDNLYTVKGFGDFKLETAPELKDGYSYVPVSFFTGVMNLGLKTDDGILAFNMLTE